MKNNLTNAQGAQEFLNLAHRDLSNATKFIQLLKCELDEGILSALCFYLSQCTEKILKALLLSENVGKISFSHNITKLIITYETYGYKVPTFIDENCAILEDWAVSSRYHINFKCDLDIAIKIQEVLSDWLDNINHLELLNSDN